MFAALVAATIAALGSTATLICTIRAVHTYEQRHGVQILSPKNENCVRNKRMAAYFGSHLCTKFCVQVGKRFVQKENFRFTDDRPSQSDPLSLTAGKRFRFSRKIHFDTQGRSW